MPNYAIDVVKTPHHLSIDWGWFGPKVVGQYPPKFQVCILRFVKEKNYDNWMLHKAIANASQKNTF